jgi:acetoacetyl-CoA synthetase
MRVQLADSDQPHAQSALDFDDSQSLFQWSVGDLEAFWGAISEYFDVRFTTAPEAVLRRDPDPVNTKWFPGAKYY